MSIKFVKFLVNGWVCDKVIKNYFYNEDEHYYYKNVISQLFIR